MTKNILEFQVHKNLTCKRNPNSNVIIDVIPLLKLRYMVLRFVRTRF